MSAEFSKLCKRLAVATAVAVLAPLGTALLLGGTQAAVQTASLSDSDEIVAAAPAPHASLVTLGRATAVAWISTGHVSH
ncbi:MAG TPA: hypothetical protein VNU97_02255 [Rhizomicrobium sp.]|nr:hypothetical protein [Rhizomicrobium sp.]